jgi:hypothetical protein
MAGICLLHEAGGWLSSGCVCVRCQILEAGWRLSAGIVFSVCYMREHDGYLSVT